MSADADADGVRVIRSADAIRVAMLSGEGEAVALVWPGMGARHRSMHRIRLPAGATSLVMRHDSDSVYFVVEGKADFVDLTLGESVSCDEGSAVHIDSGTEYQIRAETEPALLVGGACPPDPRLYQDSSTAAG